MSEFAPRETVGFEFGRLNVVVSRFDSLPSTNASLKKAAGEGVPEGTCFTADEQTAGRGRHDRTWISPRGEGLYLSILLRPKFTPERLPLIALTVAVGVAQCFQHLTRNRPDIRIDIKWPNDVLLNGKKACGVLVEAGFSGGTLAWVVAGVGINIAQRSFPDDLLYPPTSLLLELGGEPISRDVVLEGFLRAFDKAYQILETDPVALVARWSSMSSYAEGKSVRVNLGNRIVEGVTRGLRADGALRVETPAGRIETVLAGDVLHTRPNE